MRTKSETSIFNRGADPTANAVIFAGVRMQRNQRDVARDSKIARALAAMTIIHPRPDKFHIERSGKRLTPKPPLPDNVRAEITSTKERITEIHAELTRLRHSRQNRTIPRGEFAELRRLLTQELSVLEKARLQQADHAAKKQGR